MTTSLQRRLETLYGLERRKDKLGLDAIYVQAQMTKENTTLFGTPDLSALTRVSRKAIRDTALKLFDKTIDGYGELFRSLSYAEIGAAAMLSRATAGTIDAVAVFTMPGSPAGVRLALEKLILPELGHLVFEKTR